MTVADEIASARADLSRALAERRAEIATKGVALLAMPVLAALLAKSLGFYDALPPVPIPALYGRVVAWQALLVGGTVLLLVVLALLARARTSRWLVAVAVGVVLWVGYPFARLRWQTLLPGAPPLKSLGTPGIDAWLLAGALLAVPVAYAALDAAARADEAYRAKGVARDEAKAARSALVRGAARAVVWGLGAAAALAVLQFALIGPIASGLPLPRANPVVALLALGIALALALALLLRGRSPATGAPEPLLGNAEAAEAGESAEAARSGAGRASGDAKVDAWVRSEMERRP